MFYFTYINLLVDRSYLFVYLIFAKYVIWIPNQYPKKMEFIPI